MSTVGRVCLSRRQIIGRLPAVAVGVGVIGMATAACGGEQPSTQSQAPVTVHALLDPSLLDLFGANQNPAIATAPVIPTFQQANPNVKLDLEAGPGPTEGNLGMINKFKAKVAAGEQLDVYGEAASDTVTGFAKPGLLKDIGPFLAKQKAVAAKDFWSAVMGTITYQNKLYGLPYQVFTELLYYNQDILQREGQPIPTKDWTWDKLLEVCKAITRPPSGNQTVGQWGIVLGLGNFRGLGLPMMWAWGGKLFDDDTNPHSLSLDPAGAEGLQWLADMYTKYRVVALASDAAAAGQTNTNNMVGAGLVGFNYSSLTWRGYRAHTFKSDVQMLPKGKARSASSTWASCLTMPSTTKSPDAAFNLILHIAGPVGQKLLIPAQDQFPSVESIATSKDWLSFDRFNRQAAIDMIKQAKPTPPSPAWPDVNSQALVPMFADLTAGKITAMDGLRSIKAKVDDLLRTQG